MSRVHYSTLLYSFPTLKALLLRNLPQNQLPCDVIFGHHVLAGFLHEVGTMVGITMVGAVDL
jgi:hypothetical protein